MTIDFAREQGLPVSHVIWRDAKRDPPPMASYTSCVVVLVSDGNEPGTEAVYHKTGKWTWDTAQHEPVRIDVVWWCFPPNPPETQ